MSVSFSNDRAIYLQIVDFMKIDIISGKYRQGEKLPSVRDLAIAFKVNPNTMQRAFIELESLGLVYTERTNGRFVSNEEGVIENIKKQIAKTKVEEFLCYMKSLGIEDSEIITYISDVRKEKNI
ncbi:MAG: GntR family transcriptional regulator [Erysipelotrichia bacterium]|nr:GntR family transcriptional regulator [Erysipelotrichia bacterium]NCC55126.1 GntR family transcriptional regulator [Erysipelotrichia bacterium]